MEQWAWLSAVPKAPPKKGRKPNTQSRWEKMEDSGREPSFPPVEFGAYLIDYIEEFGPTYDGQPTQFSEIESWSNLTNTRLTVWEAKALRKLCVVYSAAYHKAENPKMPPPFSDAQIDRDQVARSMREKIEDHNRRMEMNNGSRQSSISGRG